MNIGAVVAGTGERPEMSKRPSRSVNLEFLIFRRVSVVRAVVAANGAFVCSLGDQEGCLMI